MSDIPDARNFLQIESARFRSAVSESLLQTMGGLANFIGHRMHADKGFFINGPYNIVSPPQTFVDGLAFFEYDAEIINAWAFHITPGTSGTTELDIKVASPGGGFSSIFSTTPKFGSAAAANSWVDAQGYVPPGTGVTAPVLSTTNVNQGQAIRIDVLQTMGGLPQNTGIVIHWIPR